MLIEDQNKDTLLYAGAAKVNVNDWFFTKKKITIQYIGLNDAVVHFKRKNKEWNYQFLIDYLSPDTKDTSSSNIAFDIKKAQFNNIQFSSIDLWKGENMFGSVKNMDVLINKTDFKNGFIDIKKISLTQPGFSLVNYDGNRTAAEERLANLDTATNTNNEAFEMRIGLVQLKNGLFNNDLIDERPIYNDHFDENHITFSNINGSIKNCIVKNDGLLANVDIQAIERNGLQVKQLKADMIFNDSVMAFKNLDILTNKSHLTHYYAMHYHDFKDDMNDFINKVEIEGDLQNSNISSDDIAIFAPELKDWHRKFLVNGKMRGTIDHFKATQLDIQSGNSQLKGSLDIKGIPDLDNMFIVLNSTETKTTYQELASIIPVLKSIQQPALHKLGNISFVGNFTGFLNNFVTLGHLQTDLGNVFTDVNFNIPEKGIPSYSGSISTSHFQLGKFINNNQFEDISVDGKISGKGFNLRDLNTAFTGYIPQLTYNGYNYQRIKVNGSFIKEQFDGKLSIVDSNLMVSNLEGQFNLNNDEIAFDLNASVEKANFKALNFTKQDLSLAGKFNLNFTGNNIDNFLGDATIRDAKLIHNGKRLSFDHLTINSRKTGLIKKITLQSNDLDAAIEGDFEIMELPNAFTLFLSNYYPAYIKKSSTPIRNQNFSFNVASKNIADYLNIFDDKISGGDNASISGKLNMQSEELMIDATIPMIGYNGNQFKDIDFKSIGSKDTLSTTASLGELILMDSIHLPDTKISLQSNNDLSTVQITTSNTSALNNANLNATVQTLNDGLKIHFNPSSFILNDKKWDIQKDGDLLFKKHFVGITDMVLSNQHQRIAVQSELDEITNQTNIIAQLDSIQLSDFLIYAFADPEIKGTLTGKATFYDAFGKMKAEFNGNADSLYIQQKLIGNVSMDGKANLATGLIDFHAISTDTTNIFALTGQYNLIDSSDKQLQLNMLGEKVHLSILSPYLSDVFDDIDGIALTNLNITGGKDHQYLTGNVMVQNGYLKVLYTQCKYYLQNQTIRFGKDEIDFPYIRIKDSLGNSAVLNGKIKHHFFDDFLFDNIRMESSKLALLNTKKTDNAQFYGNVVGSAKMNLNGPLSNLKLDIDGEPLKTDTSHIYLNTSAGKESSKIDYIDFVQFGNELEATETINKSNIVVSLNIKANPSCKVDVILDEETGDIIKGQGDGNILVRIGNIEPLSIRGKYNITKGEYNFNFQTFFQKPFVLDHGSITWNGDPYQAMIDIVATYLAKNVDISNLSPNGGFRQKEDVKIISHLTGILQNPEVKFDFELPEKSDAKRDDIIVKRLADFKNDDNEMNKQVASLLLFNTFIIGNQNFLSQGNASTFISNTIGGVVSNLLSNFFNKELEKATKGIVSTYIDINPTLDIQKSASQLQANIRAGLKILLNNRLVVLVGGNLDYNNPTYTQQLEKKGLLTPDITIEWLINKDGTLRVVGFNRSSVDLSLNQRNRSGLQLSYRKDMNKLSDIFKSKKRISEEEKRTVN